MFEFFELIKIIVFIGCPIVMASTLFISIKKNIHLSSCEMNIKNYKSSSDITDCDIEDLDRKRKELRSEVNDLISKNEKLYEILPKPE